MDTFVGVAKNVCSVRTMVVIIIHYHHHHRHQMKPHRGDPEAQRRLGYRHLTGVGVGVDYDTAFDYLDDALDGGDPEAAHWVGVMHLRGLGVNANRSVYVLGEWGRVVDHECAQVLTRSLTRC